MKNKLFLFILLQFSFSFSQTAPSIAWQKLIGGSGYELTSTANIMGSNVFLAAASNSGISGNKTQSCRGLYDYWVIKTTDNGTILWDKTMGGAYTPVTLAGSDIVTSIYTTADGSVLVGGYSNSNISGEKTEVSRGDFDYWLIKLSASGDMIWDKTLGGDALDYPTVFFELNDGNFLVAGTSYSSASGDKTEVSRGESDIWILKLSPSGGILWQKTIGGNSNDGISKVIQTPDNGFVIASNSSSNISGEKTEDSFGLNDYWIIKLDENGTIQWQRTIGGSGLDSISEIITTVDGGFLASGRSNSTISGLKTENNRGGYDYWLVKLDAFGVVEWQKTIGGNADDLPGSIYQCLDNSFIIGGTSFSSISGEKTEETKGNGDAWIIKLDDSGNLQWQKDIGGADDDGLGWVKQLPDGSFLLSGGSNSSDSFDITTTSHGLNDLWLVKLNAEELSTAAFANTTVTCYPNPTYGNVALSFAANREDLLVTLSNPLGQQISQFSYRGQDVITIPLSGASGIYFITLTNKNGERKILRVIKQD